MTLTPSDPDPIDAPPPSTDDLAVSAVVDGTATGAERARVGASSALQQRVEQLQGVRARLSEPIEPLSSSATDAMIRLALTAASPGDQTKDPAAAEPTRPPVSRQLRGRTGWLVAAAMVVLLGLGAVTLPRLTAGRSSSSDTAASTANMVDGTAQPPEGGSDARSPGERLTTEEPFAESPFREFGQVATIDTLIEQALVALEAPAARAAAPTLDTSNTDRAAIQSCLERLGITAKAELLATGSVAGTKHLVVIAATPPGTQETQSVSVVRIPDCAIVEQLIR